MRVDLVAVGNEVLYGEIPDTNSAYIAGRLFEEGFTVGRHTCVGDDKDMIADAITASLDEGASVICTGGLGPTPDDLTREALAAVANTRLVRSQELASVISRIFEARNIPMPESNYRQADLPEGARYIPQKLGTAPGIIIDRDGASVYALPGVPHEMKEMLERGVLPDLLSKQRERRFTAVKTFKVWGATEAAVAAMLSGLETAHHSYDAAAPLSISYLPSTTELKVRIIARGDDRGEAERRLAPVAREVRKRLGDLIFGEDSESLPAVLGKLLVEKEWTIAAAESLTGGLVGARLTAVPGASNWFKGSAVTYRKEAKIALLGIDEEMLETEGTVSARCAEEMAIAARKIFGADVGISCTGEAGPEALEAKVGEVYMGVAIDGRVQTVKLTLPGDRQRIREYTATSLIDLSRRMVASA